VGRLAADAGRAAGDSPGRLAGDYPARLAGADPARLAGAEPSAETCDCPAAGVGAYASILRPTDVRQWRCVGDKTAVEPQYAFHCQEAGFELALADAVNGADTGVAMDASGAVTYRQTVTDWTTYWVGTTEVAGQGFHALAGELWNVAVQSVFALWYFAVISATNADAAGNLASSNLAWRVNSNGTISLIRTGATVNGVSVYENATPTPHPLILSYDKRSAAPAFYLNTDKELITGSYAQLADNAKSLVAGISTQPPVALWNGLWVWVGEMAERMMDRGGAGLGGKTLIGDLGWSLAY
jgi:hypothetical protein